MPSSQENRQKANKDKDDLRHALDPLVTDTNAPNPSSRIALVSKAIMSPFSLYKKSESTKILSDLAPVIMTPKMVNAAASSSTGSRPQPATVRDQPHLYPKSLKALDFSTLGRAPGRLGLAGRRLTSRDLQIVEATPELLDAEIPEAQGVASDVSLLRGFNATIPSSEKGKTRRRKTRNVETPHLGLKKLGQNARGLLSDDADEVPAPIGRGRKGKGRKGRESLGASVKLGREELEHQTREIMLDKENITIRRTLINSEISEVTQKIAALDAIRDTLEANLLKLHEEELELDDELEGVRERLEYEATSSRPSASASASQYSGMSSSANYNSSRRKKGPAFLPFEHDDLPPGVAFMTLTSHQGTITALDITEPYGLLVSASSNAALEGGGARVWDLTTGEEIGRLRGKEGELEVVKALQVEDHVCVTGGSDHKLRLWDLRKVGEEDGVLVDRLEGIPEDGEVNGGKSVRDGDVEKEENDEGPCVRVLDGHSRAVTALYFEEQCLVTGASDKTIRQWDLTTGQCVLTMDILWAISHPISASSPSPSANGLLAAASGSFAVPTPPFADGHWDMYEDFVGGLQFWGYALVSGSGDSGVRMWDMRTGQAHRTLMGHTAPVTCLQFDEHHIVSGSLDKTVRIWDLRTGGISDTIRFEHPVTSVQFDSRKVVACAGENGIKIYNRTTMQQSTLMTNGHTRPAEKVRYMDRYMVSGGGDSTVKVWAL